ncbi:MAG: class I SAM-dependent methyltransferase [Desulfovibrio sp.]|uniref:class I SAM-dependent methyltransferase n=1 Tax=Desulfovibrio sp. TaxID=885 RepID=UPI0025B7E59C|nr:class I SAM-dependent methyltransferase [Desulfovibrio sp.]MBS6829563.1 class I SAM-dependent methyltransferase [Desulfovibrio sp.]
MFNPINKISEWNFKKNVSKLVPHLEKITTHLTLQEKIRLYRLVQNNPLFVLVEIGSYLGASSLCIAAGMKEKSKLYCVDTWHNDAMSEGGRDTYEEFLNNVQLFHSKITPLRGNSHSIAETFEDSVDFLFLDGDHSYEGVKTDIEAWFPKLRSGGVIAMHDIGWAWGVQKVLYDVVMPQTCKHGELPNLFWAVKI